MKPLLEKFMNDVVNGQFSANPINNSKYPDIRTNKGLIYNEFSLQHTLGAYLKKELGDSYRVEFERNSEKCFGIPTTTKHEIDIVVYNDNEKKCAIELKFPRNGQYPEQMFSFVKDIAFLEELKSNTGNSFEKAYAIVLVDDKNFYENTNKQSNNYIYSHFRGIPPVALTKNNYPKPTGNNPIQVTLKNSYPPIDWQYSANPNSQLAYYIVEV